MSDKFDFLLDTKGPNALFFQEELESIEGPDAVVFPPSFPGPKDGDKATYDISIMADGTKSALMDSVGSQANRMESMFLLEEYADLVPQIFIKTASGTRKNLLEVGQRTADSFVRFSGLGEEVNAAFRALRAGDTTLMAKLAPTTLMFGAWDSRGGTNAKCPRFVHSTIRATNVSEMTRSAVYNPPMDYAKDPDPEFSALFGKMSNEKKSKMGFNQNPSVKNLGGVVVGGSMRRDATLNLITVRTLSPDLKMRRYMLALGLLAFTYPVDMNLRQGCLLVRKPGTVVVMEQRFRDGTRKPIEMTHEEILAFAKLAASEFGVGPNKEVLFEIAAVKKDLEAKPKSDKPEGEEPEGEEQPKAVAKPRTPKAVAKPRTPKAAAKSNGIEDAKDDTGTEGDGSGEE